MIDLVINILLLLAILVVLVVIHEFGHFIVARRARVRVHEFGIGFPPRAKVLGNDGETTYTLNWLPIGGFVRLEGEEGESDDPRSFVRQRLGTRLAILLAGVAMNIVLAFVIFAVIAAVADPVADVRIAEVEAGGPAAEAGLLPSRQIGTLRDEQGNERLDEQGRPIPVFDESGEVIIAIDGRTFPVFDRVDMALPSLAYLREHAGERVTLTVQSADGSTRDVPVTLRVPGPGEGPLGIRIHPQLVQREISHAPADAIAIGARRTLDASTLILRGLGGLIANIANPPVAGPVGIVQMVGDVRAHLPPIFMLWFIGLLSANLAVINALPFPPLDGGRVAVSLIQAVSGNRVSEAAERLVYLTGFVLLMMLLVWITFFDIQRLGGS
ncbi:MAG TPA: site-2 protease family protein [Candidatus Limnocylindria bacterium]|nr:site-2 protease family protein [Candidatus Limnocylindria bacterium]